MSKLKEMVGTNDHILGPSNGSVTLVEYGDFQCPHCRIAHFLVERVLREMGENVRFVFRNFPLREVHASAFIAATASEAAGIQNKYWEMHNLLFENQDKLDRHFILKMAKDLAVDLDQFENDWESEKIMYKVESDFESGIRSGVSGTPTFFVNGVPILNYDETYISLALPIQTQINNNK
jgi:protein-disulfide isomerase